MPHVFLSHSSFDKEYVKTIAEKFGSKATYDDFSFEIGEKTFDQILSALNNTDLFVIFLSDTALNSEWVKKELNIALEKYDLGKIKQIFPIIIDSKINHKDNRIPKWMAQGFASYNLKPIESPFVAFRKIETKLKELESNFDDLEKNDFVGHEQELSLFQNEYYKVDNEITCIIASGLEGMGRTSFISQCVHRSGEFNKHYNPIIIDFSKNQSIEDVICKLFESGYGKFLLKDVFNKSFNEKIDILITQFIQIQNYNEFVIFKDEGGLINHNEIIWWFDKVISSIRPKLTIGISSKHNIYVSSLNKKRVFYTNIKELDSSNKLMLLQQITKISREDALYFENCLTGHPLQIKYCASLIKDYGLEETKSKTSMITEFSFKNAERIINFALDALSYKSDEQKENFMGYISFLATYPNVPVVYVLKVNQLCESYGVIYRTLLSLCICQKIGLTKDILSTSPLICNYIERNQVKKADIINNLLKEDFRKFENDLLESNIDGYCYSQLDYNIKTAIIDEKRFDYTFKYAYPSVILRAVVELYYSQKYSQLLDLCKATFEDSKFWEISLRNTFLFYYCMCLAHKKDKKILEIVHTKKDSHNILDENQINFIIGFYYKFIAKYDSALEKFNACIKNAPSFITARRELVEVFTTLEDYDSAMIYAKQNYLEQGDHSFHIFQYFKCCIHQKSPDKKLVKQLLEQLEKNEKLTNNRRKFFPEAQTLYYRFIIKNIDKALEYLNENISDFDNKVFYYKILFDLYEEKRDLKAMKEVYEKLQSATKNDDYYAPIIVRRLYAIYLLSGMKLDTLMSNLQIEKIGDYAKQQIAKHIKNLNSSISK